MRTMDSALPDKKHTLLFQDRSNLLTHTRNWFPGIFSPLSGQKISGAFTAVVWTHCANPQLVTIPDKPVGRGPTGIPGNQKYGCCDRASRSRAS
jgi:hypothetical protein